MSEKTMSTIRQLLAEDKKLVSYRPSLKKIVGSVTAAILLQQVIFYDNQKDGQPFYKFASPCDHKDCREGDTWEDATGFSRSEFSTAIKKIGRKIKPSEARDINLEDENGPLVWYWTDMSRVTYYKLNRAALRNAIFLHYVMQESDITKSRIPALDHITETSSETSSENIKRNGDSILPIEHYVRYFEELTGYPPITDPVNFQDKWEIPLVAIVRHARTDTQLREVIAESIDFVRNSPKYVLKSPESIMVTAINKLSSNQTQIVAAAKEDVWEKVLEEMASKGARRFNEWEIVDEERQAFLAVARKNGGVQDICALHTDYLNRKIKTAFLGELDVIKNAALQQ